MWSGAIAKSAPCASQNVALAHVCWGMMATKGQIWSFPQGQGFLRGPVEIFGEMELLRLLDQFFDRAVCYCLEGYEETKFKILPPHPHTAAAHRLQVLLSTV